ncbi:hypothetical protein PV326_001218 [Microctonus aethiopoides]|nr:hypothetical protein PV326_001218 [Microctonus aethiopoides]
MKSPNALLPLKSNNPAPTVEQINCDRITQLANKYWAPHTVESHLPFNDATRAHTLSIVVMINEKFRERVQVWEAFEKNPDQFSGFFQRVLEACLEESILDFDLKEQTALIIFLNHSFNSMEVALVRNEVKRLVSLSMWVSLQQGRQTFRVYKSLSA